MSVEQQAPEIIQQALSELRTLSSAERARQLAEDRERAIIAYQMEMTAQFHKGDRSRAIAVARRLLARGDKIADVAEISGLSEIEVRALAQPDAPDTPDSSDASR